MGTTYGGRWRVIGNLGGGGQSDIFRVIDESGALGGEYALKRLRDVSRLDRFRNEIEALKRLDNPHIVKLIDHSDLTNESPGARHFLVMPIALEGDAEKRLQLFTGSIENVVRVSLQVARALAAAHSASIVHRDVKPGNILFQGQALDIWLSDFGICHIEKEVRDTPSGAIMGPRRFAAPEIEAGRYADVPSDVDVYSLGQVIFYLLSGGKTFHRENVYAAEHNDFFQGGERSGLIRVLLGRMVAPHETRMSSMQDVIVGLTQISDWEAQAHTSVLSDEARAKILELRKEAQESEKQRDAAKTARENRAAVLAATNRGIMASLHVELEKAATFIREGGDLEAIVSIKEPVYTLQLGDRNRFRPISVAEITFSQKAPGAPRRALQFWLCEQSTIQVTIVDANASKPKFTPPQTEPPLALVPVFVYLQHGGQSSFSIVSDDRQIPLKLGGNSLSPNLPQRYFPGTRNPQPERIRAWMKQFAVSDWPTVQTDILTFVGGMIDYFVRNLG